MRVLMYGWEYPPNITGGLGTACFGITKGLAVENVNILFVVPKSFGKEDKRYSKIQDAGKIPVEYLESASEEYWRKVQYEEVSAKLIPYSTPEEYLKRMENDVLISKSGKSKERSDFVPFSGNYGKDLWNEIDRYSRVTSILARKEQYDLIHAHDWMTFPAGVAAKKISAKPFVAHIHATEFDRSNGKINRDIYDIEKKGMDESDKIITVSNYTRNIVISQYGINPDKVVTIHNGVEKNISDALTLREKNLNEKVVTFLGRITFQKGPEYFIEAAKKVLEKQKNVRFVMAGSGDLKDKIVRMVNNMGISSYVTFPGFLNKDEIAKLFSQTDLYIMPSVSEPFGISPLEALQSGVPVIISKQSGVSEVIKNAIKVDYWDTNALSDAIHAVLNYNSLSRLLATKGSIEANNMGWDRTGKKIVNLYNTLL